MKLSPVVIFVYNRPEHTRKTLDALSKSKLAKHTTLYIYSDAPRSDSDALIVAEVRKVIKECNGFKEVIIIEREINFGLGRSVVDGVSNVINKHDFAIVLEDDLITHEHFLEYMNVSLELYQADKNIYSISGYNIPDSQFHSNHKYFNFVPRISSWGWATWKDRWSNVDWDISDYDEFINNDKKVNSFTEAGKDMIDMLIHQVEGESESWAIRFDYNRFKNNAYTIYPSVSLLENIGVDGSGEHKENDVDRFTPTETFKEFDLSEVKYIEPIKNVNLTGLFRNLYRRNLKSIFLIYIRRYFFYEYYKGFYKRYLK